MLHIATIKTSVIDDSLNKCATKAIKQWKFAYSRSMSTSVNHSPQNYPSLYLGLHCFAFDLFLKFFYRVTATSFHVFYLDFMW